MRYVLLACIIATSSAFATDDKPTIQTPKPTATAVSESQSTANANVESELQAPATFISTPSSTAPCVVANGWSVGVPGAGGGRNRSRIDAECWAEYVKQAEHQRALDFQKLELERDRLSLESKRLEACLTCESQK